MGPEGSLPHSQQPLTCPKPEPDESSPWSPSHFLKIHFNIILPRKLGSFMWSSLRSPAKILSPHARYMPCPSHYSLFILDSVRLAIRLSARNQIGSQCTDLCDIWYPGDFYENLSGENQSLVKIRQTYRTLHMRTYAGFNSCRWH